MGHSYEKSKSLATKYILILAGITIGEVIFALLAKGHMIEGFIIPSFTLTIPLIDISIPLNIVALVMIVMSLVKAYLIVYEFMHMKYEVPGLVKTVLLPTLLLVWAVIAFFYEGRDWQKRRDLIINKDNLKIENPVVPLQSGMKATKNIESIG